MDLSSDMLNGGSDDPPIPPITHRLAQLRPSRELLEYYRKKIADFDEENCELQKTLDQYKSTYEDQHRLESELHHRENEIADLQKAVSDMQVCIMQEREQVLRLYSENDRLKIRDVENQKRIQHLLAIAGPSASEVSYFHKDPPAKIIVPQKLPKPNFPNEEGRPNKASSAISKKSHAIKKSKSAEDQAVSSDLRKDNQTLCLQVEALQAQLEEQTRLSRDQINSLLDDRQILREEADLCRERDKDRLQRVEIKMKNAQSMLYESTKDMLNLKLEQRNKEKEWMSEKDRLLQELDMARDQLASRHGESKKSQLISKAAYLADYEAQQQMEAEIQALNSQLEQAAKLADMYREQCIQAEDQLARIREESDVHKNVFKERTDKMAQRLQLMTQRYEALEKRRCSEVEGFKNDIKLLRKRLKDVEKQLYKVTVGGTVSDVEVLQTVRTTAGRSRVIQNDLKNLKAKLYSLESDLRKMY
ncbi:coiled-coil domain-containing protein 77-like [Styela clava]